MIKQRNGTALKEWAIVNRALREGKQIFLLRKGGISDEGGVFRMQENEFFLYPTLEHQKPEDLQELYRPWMTKILFPSTQIPLDVYAEVDSVLTVRDFDRLSGLLPFTVWSPSYLRKRLEYKPDKPLYLILLKCHRSMRPAAVPYDPSYAGCVSWVPLAASWSTDGFEPVLADEEFQKRKEQILKTLR